MRQQEMPKKSRNGYQMKFETNDDDVHFLQSLVQLDSKPISNTA